MARSVFIGITSATLGLALAASLAIPSMAMTPNDYDAATPLNSSVEVSSLFSGRLLATQNRRDREDEALRELREQRLSLPFSITEPSGEAQRPFSLTLPF